MLDKILRPSPILFLRVREFLQELNITLTRAAKRRQADLDSNKSEAQ